MLDVLAELRYWEQINGTAPYETKAAGKRARERERAIALWASLGLS